MIRFSAGSALALILVLIASNSFAATSQARKGSHKSSAVHRVGHRLRHPIGQRGIDPQRATEIQDALIKANYLNGTPSGKWDAETETAMQKYQADHGWQTKLTPDSRALIALGLGPSTAASQPLPANTYRSTHTDSAEAGTLASVHSITQ
jgi:Putative peptidoglycan binding domain